MAVLTNGNSEGQRKKTSALGLNRWIEEDRIFVRGEIGYHKPDIRAFRAVEERTGFGPRDTWYVGDSYESDVEGASRAGWHTVWLNHRKRPCPSPNSLAEVEVKEGRELLGRLRGRF
jgi:putative hydrolase of the HAD superfamily